MKNIILNTDSYKASHYLQYPKGTTHVSSYIESRGGCFAQSVFFGLQMFLKEYLSHPLTQTDIDEAQDILTAHGLPFNRLGWQKILEKHGGYLPIEIQALREGTVSPIQTALAQVINTDPECAWLTSYLETALLRAVWYPTTVATNAWHCRKIIRHYMEKTLGHSEGLPFKLHDFGARGATSEEAAAIGGAAHLVSFQGTDTLSAILAARRYYGADMAGFSIPAAEHSTITSWGREGETAAYQNILQQFSGPNKLVAVVSDSYDLFHAIDKIWGEDLREQIQKTGGTLVIRPDSGDPVSIVTKSIEHLMAKFGYQENHLGYRTLPDCIRLIQGDGISRNSIEAILKAMTDRKLSADNIAFGMGAELLQKVNRDTMQFAMKASAAQVNGQWRDVFKDPATDSRKRSKKGRLAVIRDENGALCTINENQLKGKANELIPVFRNGKLLRDWDWTQVKQRANQH